MEVGSDLESAEQVLMWGRQWGARRWAIEGPGNAWARPLVATLLAAGESVVAIPPAMTAEYRKRHWRGKDDQIDAANAARALRANPALPRYCPPDYDRQLKELTRTYQRVSHQLTATRMAMSLLESGEAREALNRVEDALKNARAQLKKTLTRTVRPLAGPLLELRGVGPVVAAMVLAEAGSITRFRSRDHFASFAGCAPVRWASGAQASVRVNSGGSRRLNWAAHIIVLGRLRFEHRTRTYRDRKLKEGKTQREIIRALKTYVCRELYSVLKSLDTSPASA
jgi:transposase